MYGGKAKLPHMHGRLFKTIPLLNLPNLPAPPPHHSLATELSPPRTLWTHVRSSCRSPGLCLTGPCTSFRPAPPRTWRRPPSGCFYNTQLAVITGLFTRIKQSLFRCPSAHPDCGSTSRRRAPSLTLLSPRRDGHTPCNCWMALTYLEMSSKWDSYH